MSAMLTEPTSDITVKSMNFRTRYGRLRNKKGGSQAEAATTHEEGFSAVGSVQRELAFVGWAENDHPFGPTTLLCYERDGWVLHGEMAVSLIKEAQWAISCAAASTSYILAERQSLFHATMLRPIEWHS
jgi:hypothetical protein